MVAETSRTSARSSTSVPNRPAGMWSGGSNCTGPTWRSNSGRRWETERSSAKATSTALPTARWSRPFR